MLSFVRKWHGGISDRYGNIHNLVDLIVKNQTKWPVPPDLLKELTERRDELQEMIDECRRPSASMIDRAQRNALLKSTVHLCLHRVKMWAYGEYAAGVMTAEDVHRFGFLLPGETGGHRARAKATDVVAEVKVVPINADFIVVVIDQAAGENAAQTAHGWPTGVRHALIVIVADDGKTEVYRRLTTRLHNRIMMPNGSHGMHFFIKASFLKHVDDEPRFGSDQVFSMPIMTEDLVTAIDRKRQELKLLQAELNAGR
jgi:hypothetical protein